jgi:cysteine desulfurase / selenocysteine lyase
VINRVNMKDKIVYMDNAATSWPKPPCVAESMVYFLNEVGANPGRSAHRLSIEAGRIVYEAREAIAELFGVPDPLRVVFGLNVTEALNLAIRGLLSPGDHVITGSLEHNSMMRPLRAIEQEGTEMTIVPCSKEGFLDPADIEKAIRPNTTLIALNHASNVVGTLLPIAEVGHIARKHGLFFLVDAAQTGGAYPIDIQSCSIDLLAFTGHKSLLGPMGTGGLIVGERIDTTIMKPLKRGGTGSYSEHEEQPDFLPDIYESGTPNVVGLAGLNASVRWIMERTVDAIRAHEMLLAQRMIDGLAAIPGITLFGSCDVRLQAPIVSLKIDGIEVSEAGLRLDEEYNILCRVGLHCSPAAHRTIGTFPTGTLRLSLGIFNTEEDVDAAIKAITRLAKDSSSGSLF